MKQSIPSTVIMIILLCVGLFILPLYYVSVIQWRNDYEIVYNECRNLTDRIIDTRQFTEEMEEDFNLAIAATNNTFTATVVREVKIVNPDPNNPGQTYTSYMVTEENREFKQGDLVTVTIEQVGLSPLQAISSRLMGLSYYNSPVSYTARVR
jgi:hypothetical protein